MNRKLTDKEKKVHSVFQNISNDYDRMNDIISFRMHNKWKNDALDRMLINANTKLLDVCCGTGDLSIIASGKNENIEITGVDFSCNMLEIANKKIENSNVCNIEFILANAMDMPFDDNVFDYVIIGFGLRNTPDYYRVICEMVRVAKPFGKVMCLDTSIPTLSLYTSIYKLYFRYIMPMIGFFLTNRKNEYKWLNDSTVAFLTKQELKIMFEDAGLSDIKIKSYAGGAVTMHQGLKP